MYSKVENNLYEAVLQKYITKSWNIFSVDN